MFKTLTKPFRKITARDIAAKELAQSECMALTYASAAAYNESMRSYHEQNVERLRDFLGYDRKEPKLENGIAQDPMYRIDEQGRIKGIKVPA